MREPVPTTHPPSRANTPNTTAPRFSIVSPPEKIRLLRKCQRRRRRFVPRSRQGTPGASSLTPPSTSSTTSSSSDSIEQSVPSNSSSRPSSTAVVAGSLRVDQGRTWILDAGGRASPATRCSSHPWPCLLILEPALPRSRGERWFRSKRCRRKTLPHRGDGLICQSDDKIKYSRWDNVSEELDRVDKKLSRVTQGGKQ